MAHLSWGRITLALTLMSTLTHAQSIHEWLDASHQAPEQKIADLSMESAITQRDAASAALYPKISLIGSVEHFNAPTNLRPVPPAELAELAASGGGYPFSRTIESAGATLSMPVFVKTLLTNTEKAKEHVASQSLKRRITMAQRDALLISANAKLIYLEKLGVALEAKERSLSATRETVAIKTKNGRLAEIDLVKIDEQINQTRLKRQEIDNARLDTEKILAVLTDRPIKHSADMKLIDDTLDSSEYLSVQEKIQETKIADLSNRAAAETLYPSLAVNANYFRRYGEAVNNGENIFRDYGSIGLTLSMPLFDKERLANTELSRIEARKAQAALSQTTLDVQNTYETLQQQYETLKRSKDLSAQSVINYEDILKTAKVAYSAERLTQEEYLRYEEALVTAKANLYAVDAALWQNLAQRAAMTGKDFKEIVQ